MQQSIWLDKPEQWDKLGEALIKAGEFGTDCETYNQPDKTSPQHRTRIQCFSVAVLTGERGAKGYRQATGRVLPIEALSSSSLREAFLSPSVKRWAHNSPHDEHSFRNHGLETEISDSLQWLRVSCPGQPQGYGLKEAEKWALCLGGRETFIELVTHTIQEVKAKRHKEKGCICGKKPCRSRQNSDWLDNDGVWRPHIRVEWTRFEPISKDREVRWAVTDHVPGHERWERWLAYSLADSVRGIMLVDWLRNRRQGAVVNPWI